VVPRPHRSAQLRAATPPTFPFQRNLVQIIQAEIFPSNRPDLLQISFKAEIRGFCGGENLVCGLLGCDTITNISEAYITSIFRQNFTLNMETICSSRIESYPENGGGIFLRNVSNHLQDSRGHNP
jgi:hypothetical protein